MEGPYLDKWGYVAKFSGETLASGTGIEALAVTGPGVRMSMLILMDGTVLPGYCPEVRDLYEDIEKVYPRKQNKDVGAKKSAD